AASTSAPCLRSDCTRARSCFSTASARGQAGRAADAGRAKSTTATSTTMMILLRRWLISAYVSLEPIADGGEVFRHESLQRGHLRIRARFRLELKVIAFRENAHSEVAIPSGS